MFLKLGQSYNISLLVTDINGDRIINDTPIVIIKDIQENMYFNGISWQADEFNIIMPHIENGVYSYQFTPDKVGVFSILAKSDTYNISKTLSLEVYDDDLIKYDWLVNSNFTIKYSGIAPDQTVNVKIVKEKDGTFWNGTEWVNLESTVTMPLLEDNLYTYTFLPDEESEYSITIVCDTDEVFYIINATATSDNIAPVFVNNNTLKSLDGSDSKTVNDAGIALGAVQITIFEAVTKAVVGKCVSNTSGEWNILLKPGNYYFVFEKTGYVSVGFERMVI